MAARLLDCHCCAARPQLTLVPASRRLSWQEVRPTRLLVPRPAAEFRGASLCLNMERCYVPGQTFPPSMWCFLLSGALVNNQLLVSICPRFYLLLTKKDV